MASLPPSPKPSQPPRRPSEAGRYAYIPDEDEDTKPGTPRPVDRFDTMARLMANLTPEERHELMLLADDWYQCPADERRLARVLVSKLAKRT